MASLGSNSLKISTSPLGGCPPTPEGCSGYLLKKGAINPSWKTRWCALDGEMMTYSRTESAPARGQIKVQGVAVEALGFRRFAVATAGRVYFLEAATGAERDSWVRGLCAAGASLLVRRHAPAPPGRTAKAGCTAKTVVIKRQAPEAPPPLFAMSSSSKFDVIQEARAAAAHEKTQHDGRVLPTVSSQWTSAFWTRPRDSPLAFEPPRYALRTHLRRRMRADPQRGARACSFSVA